MAIKDSQRKKVATLLQALGIDTNTAIRVVLTFESDGEVIADVEHIVQPRHIDSLTKAVKTELATYLLVDVTDIDTH